MFPCPANIYEKKVCGLFLSTNKLWRTDVLTIHHFLCGVCCILEEHTIFRPLTLNSKVGHNGVTALKRVTSGGK